MVAVALVVVPVAVVIFSCCCVLRKGGGGGGLLHTAATWRTAAGALRWQTPTHAPPPDGSDCVPHDDAHQHKLDAVVDDEARE